MPHFKRILAATDLSAPARHAVERAARLARLQGSTLSLLHVVDDSPLAQWKRWMGSSGEAMTEAMEAETREELHQLAREMSERSGIQVGLRLVSGPVLETIEREADGDGSDLLIIGTRGAGFLHHVLLGSTAERLLRMTRRPMLAVRLAPQVDYREVLVPVDFSEYSLRSIQLARQLAPNARITLLHAQYIPFESRLQRSIEDEALLFHLREQIRTDIGRQMDELVAQAGDPELNVRLSLGHTPTRILAAAEELGADLIVVGKHGRDAFDELLLGSVTKHVLVEATTDVLVAR